ncbi:TetR/AcrR family transcriptional regulator [Thermostaphylospora chromogena]|uniref:DNA-binding transcriptional regulator, AcrR family n=1 Tax=Thermostaphylospora chromogena TaxID=35622 RepID=A0A1H1BBB0_9ACTN|nr:TetR/AcrR family transcriptional regulator [Thermostaphylospora chromogena]SDQ49177.1 DNA-binding transcriptional regulator, AcrR family [Thermostaphylospora chromogena]
MTGKERREQLIKVSRTLFAEKGFDGTSIEEIAASAMVSKPVVYEHFGGKEGIYAVVVDREMHKLLGMITEALSASHSLSKLERAALALLEYIEESSEGFRILVRDSHAASGTGTFASLISEIASQVEDVLADEFSERGYDPKLAPMYAQMLVGMVALTGQWWLDVRQPKREEVAAHLVNLAWNGLTRLNPHPSLTALPRTTTLRGLPASRPPAGREQRDPRSDKGRKELDKQRQRELKEQEKLLREQEKQRQRELKELEKQRQRELKEQEKLLREQEKQRQRELKELEKQRQRELKELEKQRERELKEQEKRREREARLAARAMRRGQVATDEPR